MADFQYRVHDPVADAWGEWVEVFDAALPYDIPGVHAGNAVQMRAIGPLVALAADPIAPVVSVVPAMSDTSPAEGDTVTITAGVYTGTAPITIVGVLTLDGVDVTGDMDGQEYTVPIGAAGLDLEWSEVASNLVEAAPAETVVASIVAASVPYIETGEFSAAIATFDDATGWDSDPAVEYTAGRAVVDGSQVSSTVVDRALPASITSGNEVVTYANVRSTAGTIKTRLSGPATFQSTAAGAIVRHVQRRTTAADAFTEFGFVFSDDFEGEIRDAQVFDIQSMIDGPLDIYILAGQSNIEGGSALTGYDPDIDLPEFRALAVSVGDGGVFGWETDETGQSINAGLEADAGIGRPMFPCEPVAHGGGNLGGVSPAAEIARTICDAGVTAAGRTAVFLCAGRGGSDLRVEWDAGSVGTAYDLMVANLAALLALNGSNAIAGMFWCQGESSAAPNYAADFRTWLTDLQSVYGSFPVVMMEVGGDLADAGVANMIAEQHKLATGSGAEEELPHCAYVARPGGAALEADGLHFTGSTNRTRGSDAAAAMVSLLASGSTPTITDNLPDVSLVQGDAPVEINLSDYFSGALGYEIDGVRGSIDAGVLTFDPGQDPVGSETITITATNAAGSVAQTMDVSIGLADVLPAFDDLPATVTLASGGGMEIDLADYVTAGTTPFTYSLTAQTGVSIDGSEVTVVDAVGTYSGVTVDVANDAGTTQLVFDIEVQAAGISAPTFFVPDISRTTGGDMTIDLGGYVTSDGGDPSITYGLTAQTGVSLAGSVLTFVDTEGTYSGVEVTATNSAGTTAVTFDFTVAAAGALALSSNLAGVTLSSVAVSGGHDVTVSGNVAYNGTYFVSQADLDTGLPINVVPPVKDATATLPTITAIKGLWIWPNGDPALFEQQVWQDDAAMVASGLTYVIPDGSEESLFEYREVATNLAGEASTEITLQEVGSFTEYAVQFDDTQTMSKTSPGIGIVSSNIIAGSMTVGAFAGENQVLLGMDDGTTFVELQTDGDLRVVLKGASTKSVAAPHGAATGDRLSFAYVTGADGTSLCRMVVDSSGTVVQPWSEIASLAAPGVGLNLSQDFKIGTKMNGTGGFRSILHRFAIWHSYAAGNIDATTLASQQSVFFDTDGSIKNPSASNTAVGETPWLELNGPAADFNAGTAIIDGTSTPGYFTVTGSFTDA